VREIAKYSNCFVCGDCNRHGLQAKFFYDGGKAFTDVIATEAFEGYRGIYHGGIISTLLDEVMIKSLLAEDVIAVTAELTVRYHRPVETGQKLKFVGSLKAAKGRIYRTEGQALDEAGNIYASATGKYIKPRSDLQSKLAESVKKG